MSVLNVNFYAYMINFDENYVLYKKKNVKCISEWWEEREEKKWGVFSIKIMTTWKLDKVEIYILSLKLHNVL